MPNETPIILFDGVCNLCNQTVLFILKYERNQNIKFATLQSDAAKKLLRNFKEEMITDSVILVEKGKLYQQSTAALHIAKKLKYFRFFYILIIIPTCIRDLLYRYIARNRYKWFGIKSQCMVPSSELQKRFI